MTHLEATEKRIRLNQTDCKYLELNLDSDGNLEYMKSGEITRGGVKIFVNALDDNLNWLDVRYIQRINDDAGVIIFIATNSGNIYEYKKRRISPEYYKMNSAKDYIISELSEVV